VNALLAHASPVADVHTTMAGVNYPDRACFGEPSQIDFAAPARRRARALESDWPWLANTHG